MTDRLHSYLIPAGARDVSFRANVTQWFDVVASQAGAVLLGRTSGEAAQPAPQSSLLNAQGHRVASAAPDAPEWTVHVRMDGEEVPPGRCLGGFAAHGPNGALAGIFIFVEGPHG